MSWQLWPEIPLSINLWLYMAGPFTTTESCPGKSTYTFGKFCGHYPENSSSNWETKVESTHYSKAGMPRVTDKQPTRWRAGFRGPFKYYDQAVRDMGTGTEWRQWGSEQWKPVYFSDSL